jgi:hypothetical protein
MNNVTYLSVETTLPIPVERILEMAKEKVDEVVVVGYVKDSHDLYCASSTADLGVVLVLLERAKALIMRRLETTP